MAYCNFLWDFFGSKKDFFSYLNLKALATIYGDKISIKTQKLSYFARKPNSISSIRTKLLMYILKSVNGTHSFGGRLFTYKQQEYYEFIILKVQFNNSKSVAGKIVYIFHIIFMPITDLTS